MSVISIYNKTSVSSHFSDHNLTSLLGEKHHHAVPANTEVVLKDQCWPTVHSENHKEMLVLVF